MCGRKLRNVPTYKLSPAAEGDLVDIYVRGMEEWGIAASDRYQEKLVASFRLLAGNPGMGRSVAVYPSLQRHEVFPYVVFYRTCNYGVRIVRVLYKNRAMERHL